MKRIVFVIVVLAAVMTTAVVLDAFSAKNSFPGYPEVRVAGDLPNLLDWDQDFLSPEDTPFVEASFVLFHTDESQIRETVSVYFWRDGAPQFRFDLPFEEPAKRKVPVGRFALVAMINGVPQWVGRATFSEINEHQQVQLKPCPTAFLKAQVTNESNEKVGGDIFLSGLQNDQVVQIYGEGKGTFLPAGSYNIHYDSIDYARVDNSRIQVPWGNIEVQAEQSATVDFRVKKADFERARIKVELTCGGEMIPPELFTRIRLRWRGMPIKTAFDDDGILRAFYDLREKRSSTDPIILSIDEGPCLTQEFSFADPGTTDIRFAQEIDVFQDSVAGTLIRSETEEPVAKQILHLVFEYAKEGAAFAPREIVVATDENGNFTIPNVRFPCHFWCASYRADAEFSPTQINPVYLNTERSFEVKMSARKK